MLLCCASLCCTSTMTARLAARCAPLCCAPSRGTRSCFHVLALPCWSSAPPEWCCDAGSELWQHFNCSITCTAEHITSERLQLTASCSELVRHRRRSVAQTFLGILGMLEAHACSGPRYWKSCFAACLARKSGTRKRTSGDWTACSLDGVNVTDVRLHESFQQRSSLSCLLTYSSASQFCRFQQFLFI